MQHYKDILKDIHNKLLRLGKKFDSVSPWPSTEKGIYPISDGLAWTDSFYVGMLWLDWACTQDGTIKENIEMQMWEFEQRLKQNRELDHHDVGFLYILSAVAGYKLTKEDKYKEMAVKAAKLLSSRYHESAEFIQAWGDANGRENYRLIIDCMLNIPLLYWCAEETGDAELYSIAYKHAKTTSKTIFREDFSTYHTYFFDYDTGKPLYGKTAQGAGDDTAWSRGQAWAIYGFALSYHYTKDEVFMDKAKKAADYFLSHLPKDKIAYWDLSFSDGSGEPRDSSAAAIAVCGLLEIAAQTTENSEYYKEKAEEILNSLCKNYFSAENAESLLDHATYSLPANIGVDEGCIWGDYYFVEALVRLAYPDKFVLFW